MKKMIILKGSLAAKTLMLAVFMFGALFMKAQIITTVVGDGTPGATGYGGLALNAKINNPAGVCINLKKNILYFIDQQNNQIQKIDLNTNIFSTIAGTGIVGYSGDGNLAINAKLNLAQGSMYQLSGICLDQLGNIYFSDIGNNIIRKIDIITNNITTIVGNSIIGYAGDKGLAILASLNGPTGLAFDGYGNLYFSDYFNRVIRKISNGTITTFAGNGKVGDSGDGGLAKDAEFHGVLGLCFDSYNNLYLSDYYNHRVRIINAFTNIITNFAGIGLANYSGDGDLAVNASLNSPCGLFADKGDNIIICDQYNAVIRKVMNSNGKIFTIAGNGIAGGIGDGGLATLAEFYTPSWVCEDNNGNVYISDTYNNRIRKVNITTTISGVVTYDNTNSTPLQGVQVALKDLTTGEILSSAITDAFGHYTFDYVMAGEYQIITYNPGKPGGINPVDALQINKFFVKLITTFGDSLKQKAADVNADNKINPLDALEVNRYFVQLQDKFKGGKWLFDQNSIIKTDAKKSIVCNFKAICVGDANGSNLLQ